MFVCAVPGAGSLFFAPALDLGDSPFSFKRAAYPLAQPLVCGKSVSYVRGI